MNKYWISVLIQEREPVLQPRVKAAIVGFDDEDCERMPLFPSQLLALRWWMEHKEKFDAPAPSVIVRGSPQEFHGVHELDLENAADDVMYARPHLVVREGFTLQVADDGTPTWKSTGAETASKSPFPYYGGKIRTDLSNIISSHEDTAPFLDAFSSLATIGYANALLAVGDTEIAKRWRHIVTDRLAREGSGKE